MFSVHKPGQGKLSRTFTLLTGLFFVAWGARSIAMNAHRLHSSLGMAWNELLSKDVAPADAMRVDLVIYEDKFSPGMTLGLLALVVGAFLFFRWVNSPKIAEKLILMEAEMHKVSWPSFPDAWQSTLVVSGFTALIVLIVFFYDLVIKGLIDLMPVAGGS